MDIFEAVRDLSMRDVAERYGFTIERGSNICCPFHGDKHPSLKIYSGSRGWFCFVCGFGGTPVDFVMRLFNIPALDAAKRLAADFGIAFDEHTAKPDTETLRKLRRNRYKAEAAEQATKKHTAKLLKELRELRKAPPDETGKTQSRIEQLEFEIYGEVID